MPGNETEAERKLRTLSKRLKQGWAEMYPVPKKAMEQVRNAVREQWEQEQEVVRKIDKARQGQQQPGGPGQQISRPKKSRSLRKRSRDQDLGHEY